MLSLPALTRLRHPLPEGEGSLDQFIHSFYDRAHFIDSRKSARSTERKRDSEQA
jgi:hypothetical protein